MTARRIDLYGRHAPRDVPMYSVADAARIVRVPAATLRTWALGRSYATQTGSKRWAALIRIADPKHGRLSFRNLVEIHVLSALRDHRVRVDRIRGATAFIRREMRTDHPLADVDIQTDFVDVYVEYFGRLINASRSNVALREIIARQLRRVERDDRGIASRLFPSTRERADGPRVVLIDPARRFGRPVVASANVETSAVYDRFLAGESASELALDLGIGAEEAEEAIRFESQLRAA